MDTLSHTTMSRTTKPWNSAHEAARSAPVSPTYMAKGSNDLLRLSRAELRRLIRRSLRAGSLPSLSDPTALINEVARQLLGAGGLQDYPDRGDFRAGLANTLRRSLRNTAVDHLPADVPLMLTPLGPSCQASVEAVDAALGCLEQYSPQHAQLAILMLLGGLTFSEIAEQLGKTERSVAINWTSIRLWLLRRLVLTKLK